MFISPDLQRHAGHYYSKYSGIVTDNDDPEQRGRVKVQVPSVLQDVEAWARPCLPYGHFFIPPVGTQVWVEFEAGDPNYPIWVGVWYLVDQVPEEAKISPPDNRVIQTASGHTIQIMDQDGEEKIVIKHKDDSFVSIDKNGSVLIANQKGSFLFLDAENEKATFMEQHGNLITMSDQGVVIANQDGSLVELNGDTTRIGSQNILLQGASVAVGSGASEPAILGQTFANMWLTFGLHTHPTAMGPSGPPVPPAQPLIPGSGLASATMVK
jgi:uncharacterized protein involved in type VI secretion and phage assembly